LNRLELSKLAATHYHKISRNPVAIKNFLVDLFLEAHERAPNSFYPKQETAPGAVIAIQTFGDFLNFNPHCHVLCTDGGFYASGSFKVAQALDTEPLEKIFQHKVLGMLLREGKITEEVVKLIMSWGHSGFNVHCGPRIQPGDEEAMENPAPYVVRASFCQERRIYLPDESRVLYRSKDEKKREDL